MTGGLKLSYQAPRCAECAGSRCSWECEPCMHGESCGSKCIDDLCRGAEVHYDCERCDGTGREPEDADDTLEGCPSTGSGVRYSND